MDFGRIENITFKYIEDKELKDISVSLKGINSSNKENTINKLKNISKIETIISVEIETDNFFIKVKPNLGKYLMVNINHYELSSLENVLNINTSPSSSIPLILDSIKFYDIPEYRPINYIEYLIDDTYKYQVYKALYLCICFENFENRSFHLIYTHTYDSNNNCHLSIHNKNE